MANICQNELHILTNDGANEEAITKWFKENFNFYNIEDSDPEELIVYFDSKWDFPEQLMEDLANSIPNKENVSMVCLSVEWGNFYCAFFSWTDSEGWIYRG